MGKQKAKKKEPIFDDYEYGYGYDYLLDEEQKKPTDTADDADGQEDEGAWWEDESEEKILAYIREAYREDSDEGREYKPDDEAIDIPLENLLLDGVALELKLKPEEKEELEETEGRKLLQRELREKALRRYEESAGQYRISRISMPHGTSWTLTGNAKSDTMNCCAGTFQSTTKWIILPLQSSHIGTTTRWSDSCSVAISWTISLTVPTKCTI